MNTARALVLAAAAASLVLAASRHPPLGLAGAGTTAGVAAAASLVKGTAKSPPAKSPRPTPPAPKPGAPPPAGPLAASPKPGTPQPIPRKPVTPPPVASKPVSKAGLCLVQAQVECCREFPAQVAACERGAEIGFNRWTVYIRDHAAEKSRAEEKAWNAYDKCFGHAGSSDPPPSSMWTPSASKCLALAEQLCGLALKGNEGAACADGARVANSGKKLDRETAFAARNEGKGGNIYRQCMGEGVLKVDASKKQVAAEQSHWGHVPSDRPVGETVEACGIEFGDCTALHTGGSGGGGQSKPSTPPSLSGSPPTPAWREYKCMTPVAAHDISSAQYLVKNKDKCKFTAMDNGPFVLYMDTATWIAVRMPKA